MTRRGRATSALGACRAARTAAAGATTLLLQGTLDAVGLQSLGGPAAWAVYLLLGL